MTRGGNGSHWDECWRSHIDCAIRRIETLQAELARCSEDFNRESEQAARLEAELTAKCDEVSALTAKCQQVEQGLLIALQRAEDAENASNRNFQRAEAAESKLAALKARMARHPDDAAADAGATP